MFSNRLSIQKKKNWIKELDFGYRYIGGKGMYKTLTRPWFGFPTNVTNPEYQTQGLISNLLFVKYNLGKELTPNIKLTMGLSLNKSFKPISNFEAGSRFEKEVVTNNADEYFKTFTSTIGTSLEFKFFPLVSLSAEYEYFITSINSINDAFVTRPYRPMVISLMLKIYNK